MTNKEIIIKSLNYIENNLQSELTVFEIAKEVGYSLFHFIRLFQNITGFSPKHFIQQRRLSEAVCELQDTDKKISAIAYDYQFGSPEAFSRAFRKLFAVSPGDVRKGAAIANLQLLRPLTLDDIYQSDQLRNEPPELLYSDERILVGTSFFIANDSEINDLSKEWNLFLNEVTSIQHIKHPSCYYQVQYWSDNQEVNGMYFFTGLEVTKLENINPFFVVKIIPAGQYLRFIHKGLANKVGYTYRYIYKQFLPNTDYILNKPFNFEYYGEKCLGPYNDTSESEIFIPISRINKKSP